MVNVARSANVHRSHDLLWLAEAPTLHTDSAWPSWAETPWPTSAPVVVRRAAATRPDHIAIGLRGMHRHERMAAEVDAASVLRVTTPEDIARSVVDSPLPMAPNLACLRTLIALAPQLDAQALAWGVTGGVGFMLASGIAVLRDDSDLDLLVRAPSPAAAAALRALSAALTGHPARIDVQVEAPRGAFALHEWLRTGGPVLLKTSAGPRLVDDPWAQS